MHKKRISLRTAAILGSLLIGGTSVHAQVAEDSSQGFKDGLDAMGAAVGLPEPESTVTTTSDGITSAVLGVSHMKTLVARQNPDGSISYGHTASSEDTKAFIEGQSDNGLEEQ